MHIQHTIGRSSYLENKVITSISNFVLKYTTFNNMRSFALIRYGMISKWCVSEVINSTVIETFVLKAFLLNSLRMSKDM